MQRGVERALRDLKALAGDPLDPAQDCESMHGSPAQGLEDQQVERAAQEIEVLVRHIERSGKWEAGPAYIRFLGKNGVTHLRFQGETATPAKGFSARERTGLARC